MCLFWPLTRASFSCLSKTIFSTVLTEFLAKSVSAKLWKWWWTVHRDGGCAIFASSMYEALSSKCKVYERVYERLLSFFFTSQGGQMKVVLEVVLEVPTSPSRTFLDLRTKNLRTIEEPLPPLSTRQWMLWTYNNPLWLLLMIYQVFTSKTTCLQYAAKQFNLMLNPTHIGTQKRGISKWQSHANLLANNSQKLKISSSNYSIRKSTSPLSWGTR